MQADMYWKVGDSGPVWQINLGDPQPEEEWDLDGVASVVIYFWDVVTGASIGSATCEIIDSPLDIVEFDPNDLLDVTAEDRDLFAEVIVEFSANRVETFPNDRHLLVHVHRDNPLDLT